MIEPSCYPNQSDNISPLKNDCIILGSGASLFQLTPDQIDLINRHPRTIAMNRFVIFHELIGIKPKYVFIGDVNIPAPRIFVDSIRVAQQMDVPPHFYVHRKYCDIFRLNQSRPNLKFSLKMHYRALRENHDLMPWSLNYPLIEFFNVDQSRWRDFHWGTSLNDRLYWCRASLSTAINLATVLFPDCDIRLAGVDLNHKESFYSEELVKYPHYVKRKTAHLVQQNTAHFTAVELDGIPTIQQALKKIIPFLQMTMNTEVTSMNKQSLLVEEGICSYLPLEY